VEQFEVQVAMHQCRILFYMGKAHECVARGLQALSIFEPRLPSLKDNPTNVPAFESEVLSRILEMTKDLGLAESYRKLPVLRDNFLLAAHSLLCEMIAPLAWAAPHLLHTIPLIAVSLTLQHGKCVQASFHVPLTGNI
jgi:hypothetical protein